MNKLNKNPLETYPLLDDNGYVLCKLYEHRYTIGKFILNEYSRFKSGAKMEYNFPYEIGTLLLSTFNPGYRLIGISDTNFAMRIVYNITEYTTNVISKLNSTGKFQLYTKLSGNNSILSKQMIVWLFACTIDCGIRSTIIDDCMPVLQNEVIKTYKGASIPECCENILKGWKFYSLGAHKNAYTTMVDSVKALEVLKVFDSNYVYNISYTPGLSKYKMEVYAASDGYFRSIMARLNELNVSSDVQDYISNILLKLSYLICHGLDKNIVSVVLCYNNKDAMVLLTNTKGLHEFAVSVPKGQLIAHTKSVCSNVEKYTCTNRIKHKGVVARYELTDEKGNKKEMDADTLREMLASGKIFCTNLKLYRNGALHKIKNKGEKG